MKREFKEGDVLYLGLIELELLEFSVLQEDFNAVDSCSYEGGYGFAYTGEELVWIPKSVEQLLSYTPYTISKDGKLNGFSYEKPWQSKAEEIKETTLQKGDLIVVWDDDLSRYLRRFLSLSNDNFVKVYASANTNNVFQRAQGWQNYEPYTPLKGVTPVAVAFEIEGQMDDEQFIRLLVENPSDIEMFAKQQNLIRSSYIYEGQGKMDYKIYDKNNFKFD